MKRPKADKSNRGHIGRKRVLYNVSLSLLPERCSGFSSIKLESYFRPRLSHQMA